MGSAWFTAESSRGWRDGEWTGSRGAGTTGAATVQTTWGLEGLGKDTGFYLKFMLKPLQSSGGGGGGLLLF